MRNGVTMARAIRRMRGYYYRAGESAAQITARWRKFRANSTRKQRYLWIVVYMRD